MEKTYWKSQGILSEKWEPCGHTFFPTRIVYSKFEKVTSMEYFDSLLKWVLKVRRPVQANRMPN